MHFKSNNVIKDGSCRDTYKAFNDEPEAGQKPPAEEEKSGFNLGGLLMAAAAAVAVVAAACIGAICSSSVAAAAAGVESAMGALAISSCTAVCGAMLWDNSNSDEEDIEGFSYYEKIPKYHLSLKRLRDSKGFFETAKNLGIFAFDRTIGFFGELNTQLALNMGIDPEWAEATGECSSGMLTESFIAISIVGIRAAQAVRSGKAISSGDTIVGSGIGNVAKSGSGTVEGVGNAPKSIINDEMRGKILNGHRKNPNKNELIGGHSPEITNANPNYAVEDVLLNEDGTRKVKFTTQFSDGKLAKVKTSTLFPGGWSEDKIIASIKNIGDTPSIGVRSRDGPTLHRGVIDGVQIEVIKIGDTVTSGYPTGGEVNGLLAGFE